MNSSNHIFVARLILAIGVLVALGSIFQILEYNNTADTLGVSRRMVQHQKDDATTRLVWSLIAIGGAWYWLKKNKPLDSVSSATHVKCPDCAELVKAEAKVCKHCGAKLNAEANMRLVADPIVKKKVDVQPNGFLARWRSMGLLGKVTSLIAVYIASFILFFILEAVLGFNIGAIGGVLYAPLIAIISSFV